MEQMGTIEIAVHMMSPTGRLCLVQLGAFFFFSEYWKDQALLRNGFRAQFCVLYELKIMDNSMSEFASV